MCLSVCMSVNKISEQVFNQRLFCGSLCTNQHCQGGNVCILGSKGKRGSPKVGPDDKRWGQGLIKCLYQLNGER